jgi:S-DNA-T family DNA segregation ATPase FtsK/SpoIIIE
MAALTLTATELTFAVLDPVWREKWLAGERPSTRSLAPSGSPRALSLRFHKEAEALVKWLTGERTLAAAAQVRASADLLDHLWAASLQAMTDKLLEAGRGDEAAAFVARIRAFCDRLIGLQQRIPHFENWQDLFVGAELDLQGIRVPVGSSEVEVRARVDALRNHPERGWEVVDYKLSQGARQQADMVQLAIYARLLPIWRPGCEFAGALEYYLPEFSEVAVSRAELFDIFETMAAPVLQQMLAPKPTPKPTRVAFSSDHDALAARVVEAFASFKLAVEAAGSFEGPQLVRLRLKPGSGVKVASLANRADDLQVALALDAPPLVKAGKGFVTIDLPRASPQTCLLKDVLTRDLPGLLQSPVAFPVGVGVEGEPIVADLADPNTCHALVAGATGSGKSEWLKSLVAAIASRSGPDSVRFALVDPKILTFSGTAGSPYLWRPLATTLEEASAILEAAVDEMEARYRKLDGEGFANLAERRRAGRTDLPYLVLVFDEFADLILAGGEEKKTFETLIKRIAGKGRAAGVHLVLATQRPDRNVVTGLVKANLPLKICLKVANAANAQIVLDEAGAENLFGRGDLLCDLGKGPIRAQGVLVSQADFIASLKG